MLTFCSRIRLHGTWECKSWIVGRSQIKNTFVISEKSALMWWMEVRGAWHQCWRGPGRHVSDVWWCLKWRVKYWAKMSTTYITNYWEGFENLLTHCYNTHRAQYLSIAILHAQDSQSVSCNSFLQMKWYKNVLFGCFTSTDSNFQNQHKYYSSAASNVNTNIQASHCLWKSLLTSTSIVLSVPNIVNHRSHVWLEGTGDRRTLLLAAGSLAVIDETFITILHSHQTPKPWPRGFRIHNL